MSQSSDRNPTNFAIRDLEYLLTQTNSTDSTTSQPKMKSPNILNLSVWVISRQPIVCVIGQYLVRDIGVVQSLCIILLRIIFRFHILSGIRKNEQVILQENEQEQSSSTLPKTSIVLSKIMME